MVPCTPHRRSAGFTLIELLIVVAIIAILAAIAVPNFLEAQTRAKVARVKNDIRTFATALESYRVDSNNYPATPWVNVFDGGIIRVMPNRISTPVAYISSAGIEDPFMISTLGPFQAIRRDGTVETYQELSPDDPANNAYRVYEVTGDRGGFRYYYNSNADPRRSASAQASLAIARNFEGDWIMLSLGPNRKRDLLANSFMPYDPTNGTSSDGDVIRSQKFSDTVFQN